MHGQSLVQTHGLVQVVQEPGPTQTALRFGQGVIGLAARPGVQLVQLGPIGYRPARAVAQDNEHGDYGGPGPACEIVYAEWDRGRHQDQFRGQIGYTAPVPLAEQGQPYFGEHPAVGHSTTGKDKVPGFNQGVRFGGATFQLQSEVTFHRDAQVSRGLVILAPGAVFSLFLQNVVPNLAPSLRVFLTQEM